MTPPTLVLVTPATARRGPLRTIRTLAFRVFYGLPPRLRRRMVRLGVGTYTVGAVVLVTEAKTGRLLMVRQPPGKGWSLPAGLLARGERPAEGAVRELQEETGLMISADSLVPAVPNAVVHTRGRWIDVVFLTTVSRDSSLSCDGSEIIEAAWQPIEALPPVTPATARLLAHYGLGPYADYPEAAR